MATNSLQQFEEKYSRVFRMLFFAILLLGLYLRCYQYFMGRSLWEDEAHLALNFITRGYLDILKPLDYMQAAPVLYLLTVKTFGLIGGNTPMALRALPFLAALLTLPLCYHLLFALTKSKTAALLGFFTFSVNLEVIYYSSELKTYGVDVAVYLLLIYLLVSQHAYVKERRNVLLAIAGGICILYSNVAFIILFCVAACLMLDWYRERKVRIGEFKVLAVWALVFLINYFLFIFHHPHAKIQREWWAHFSGFPPLPLFSPAFGSYMQRSIREIAFSLLLHVSDAYGFAFVLLFILIVAIVHAIYRKRYTLLLVTCLPILIHFTLSLFRIYPFWYRLILYIVPALIVLMSYGVFIIARFIAARINLLVAISFLLICGCFFTLESIRLFPRWNREVKPALNYINSNYPGSYLYITTPYTLYKYYTLTGYNKDTLFEGLEWKISPEKYYESVAGANRNYLLLHAADFEVDGYRDVMADLKQKHLVVKEFTSRTYTVSEIKPLSPDSTLTNLNSSWFNAAAGFDLNGKKVAAIWSKETIYSRPVFLAKGTYKITIMASGTPVAGVFPHLNVTMNDHPLTSFYTQLNDVPQEITVQQTKDEPVVFRITMDNDRDDAAKKEDRNAFIHRIAIRKMAQ